MTWWRVRFVVPTAFAESVAWMLAEELDHPAEIQDESTMSRDGDSSHSAVVLAFGERPDSTKLDGDIRRALAPFNLEAVSIETQRSEDESWREGWRAFFKSTALSDRIGVRPPWEPGIEAQFNVVIDPGMAFGTGTHATTRGCMKMLDALLGEQDEIRILDVGCGSAILGIAAALLGHSVVGVDVDGDALRNAAHNLELNNVVSRVELIEGSAASVTEAFPLVVANILAPILIENADAIGARCSADLILSGLMRKHEADISKAYSGFELVTRREEGEWIVLHLRLR